MSMCDCKLHQLGLLLFILVCHAAQLGLLFAHCFEHVGAKFLKFPRMVYGPDDSEI